MWSWAESEKLTLSGILNTHQHHDHVRGNAFLLAQGVEQLGGIEEFVPGVAEKQTWSSPGHTMEHVVYWVHDGRELLFAGDTLFQAGVGNCKNGGRPAALYQTLQDWRGKLSADAVIYPGHDYLEKNLQFALHVNPENSPAEELLEELQKKTRATEDWPPLKWGDELRLNPFLLAANEDEFTNLRSQRDQW